MEWLDGNKIQIIPPKRPKKLTGTRFATILGLNPWSTPFEIWCEVTRTYQKPFEDTIYTIAGKTIEPKQAEYMKQTYFMSNLVTPTDIWGKDYFRQTYGDFFRESPVLGGMWDYLLYGKDGKPTTAPASTKYHGNYEGGLLNHSRMVTEYLLALTQANHLIWRKARSPFIVGMFHDLCKIDQYRHPVTGHIEEFNGGCTPIYDEQAWEYNPDTLLKGHGDKSVMLLSQFYTLTDEEIMCIRYHMGAFTDKSEWNDYTRAVRQYPNVLWTHQADMLASHVVGV